MTVDTRSRAKAEPLLARGAQWAASPADAADCADAAISMVGIPSDVEEVHLGPRGTLATMKPPRFTIDMTTSSPRLARRIAERAKAMQVGAIDAPVSGGAIGARNATLSIMVGGEARAVHAMRPHFERLGKTIVHHGGPGAGQHAKVVNQILVAASMVGMCEGLLYARTAGLDLEKVLQSVGSGAAGSWAIANLAPRMIRRDFQPGFFVEHFIKDLGLALDEARDMHLDLPGLALARRLYELVRADGHGRLGTHALLLTLERMNARATTGSEADGSANSR